MPLGNAEQHPLLFTFVAHQARLCTQAVVPLSLQEARKTVTAGAAFRPFPGDDWQASGELVLLCNTSTHLHAGSTLDRVLHAASCLHATTHATCSVTCTC